MSSKFESAMITSFTIRLPVHKLVFKPLPLTTTVSADLVSAGTLTLQDPSAQGTYTVPPNAANTGDIGITASTSAP